MDKIKFDEKNYRKHSEDNKRKIKRSLQECGAGRSILMDADGYLIAGNGVYEQASALSIPTRIIETDGSELVVIKRTDLRTDDEKRKLLAYADNYTSDDVEWDMETLTMEIDEDVLKDWGMDVEWMTDEEEYERRSEEFKARIASGEITEEDEEYQEFLKKFELKKTTDDCYTPALVYDAVADWVAKEYGVDRKYFVRPFYPGGDYQREKYKSTDIVVDNPPFSIMSEIIRFYMSKGVKFFLFGPHLTLFSGASAMCTSIPVGAPITYENGAVVNTSFITNIEDSEIRFRSAPELYAAVKIANEENLRQTKRELPKYSYPPHVIMTPLLSGLSRFGIDFKVRVAESELVGGLDSQKASKKAIYGHGYLVSDRVVAEREKAEREKAEREKAEREKAERWDLSPRELEIIEALNQGKGRR